MVERRWLPINFYETRKWRETEGSREKNSQ